MQEKLPTVAWKPSTRLLTKNKRRLKSKWTNGRLQRRDPTQTRSGKRTTQDTELLRLSM